MSEAARRLVLSAVVLVLAACSATSPIPSPTPGPAASGASPSGQPSATPGASTGSFGAIEHAAGATDVLLRYEIGGGFVPAGFFATQAPTFTLYGDGTVIFQPRVTNQPPAVGSIIRTTPFRTAKLSEDQIQSTLEFALGQGGLGIARLSYENQMVADAPTSTFSVDAGGVKKVVSVYALGIEVAGMADVSARAAFKRLADRLADFDQGGSVATDVYVPDRFRGVLNEGAAPAPDQIAWPWSTIAPADFPFPADPNAFQSAQRVLTAAEVKALGTVDMPGGFMGLVIRAPTGTKIYSLSLRPLLPDESA